ncbi:DUF2627 domain-containing protein [Paenibacillus lactis]|uniref:DUF2627 domain-containing protein n=1 Tax=Paenibacillus lactis TaxID=228574 RepID=UPI0036B6D608
MKMIISRFIAILILVVPGFMAMKGFLMMKDAVFLYIAVHGDDRVTDPSFGWLPFLGGLALFVLGIGFLGGWILFRDRKRNYVGPRFKKKRSAPKPGTSSGS